jgi:hypothetical protein
MNASNNRANHDFQILHFLVGSCFTSDGAYALLKDLEEEKLYSVSTLRNRDLMLKKNYIKIQKLLNSEDELDRIDGEILKNETENTKEMEDRCANAAIKELEFIQLCIERIQPHRKYAHLPDAEAHEATQRDEWKFEFIHRAENCLLTTGAIATDQFGAMRQHPDFATEILPAIENTKQLMLQNVPAEEILKLRSDTPTQLLLCQEFPTINPSLLLKNEG